MIPETVDIDSYRRYTEGQETDYDSAFSTAVDNSNVLNAAVNHKRWKWVRNGYLAILKKIPRWLAEQTNPGSNPKTYEAYYDVALAERAMMERWIEWHWQFQPEYSADRKPTFQHHRRAIQSVNTEIFIGTIDNHLVRSVDGVPTIYSPGNAEDGMTLSEYLEAAKPYVDTSAYDEDGNPRELVWIAGMGFPKRGVS